MKPHIFHDEARTVRCNATALTLAGAAPKMNPAATIADLALFSQSEKSVTGSKDFTVPPGLRLVGDYAGPGGFSIGFHHESAVVGCGEAVAALSYSIQSTGRAVLVRLENAATPIVLTMHPDGTLSAPERYTCRDGGLRA